MKDSANFIIAAFKGEKLPQAPRLPSDAAEGTDVGPGSLLGLTLSNLPNIIPIGDILGWLGVTKIGRHSIYG